MELFFQQLGVWGVGFFILFTITKNIPPILRVFLPYLFGTPRNWVDIISLASTFSIFMAGIRVIIPMAGMEVKQFDTVIGLILGSFAFTLRTFIGNLIAYVYIQYEGSIECGHYLEYNNQFYKIIEIKSQFVELEGEKGIRILIPMEFCISRSNRVSKDMPIK